MMTTWLFMHCFGSSKFIVFVNKKFNSLRVFFIFKQIDFCSYIENKHDLIGR